MPVFKDAFRLMRIVNHADGDDRYGDRVLDRPGQRHLIARTDRDVLARVSLRPSSVKNRTAASGSATRSIVWR